MQRLNVMQLPEETIQEILNSNQTVKQWSRSLGVSTSTIERNLRARGLKKTPPHKGFRSKLDTGASFWILENMHKVNSHDIAQKFNVSKGTLERWIKKLGLQFGHSKKWSRFKHPKGAVGHKHSVEFKIKQSQRLREIWRNMSEEEMHKRAKTASALGRKRSSANRTESTWKAGWREIGGKRKYYRSRWEANYARFLEMLKVKGQISDWHHEKDVFWFEGIKRGVMSYLPDFRVINNNGSVEYHEVKGWEDARSKTIFKRMAKYHPNVKLVVVRAPEYNELKKKLSGVLEGWE